ncbi:hypothetical protein [Myroides sp. N17-2]|uniref:hypothetical protein n=1 Tax=Myroides sp. N17-2 TaxID=2030799 RepID=UPI000EFCBF19|nr:hypothetical protein [Myroides sp. N17-2]
MRKNIIQFIVLFGTVSIYAQTGIGTVLPDRNAILDVSSTDKGILIPRMKLTGEGDISTIPGGNYTDGLTVFNTGTTNFEAGFYFWGKGKWNALISNNTLYKYIEEKADPNSVQIIKKGDDFTFVWKEGGVENKKDISVIIKEFETKPSLVVTPKVEGGNTQAFDFRIDGTSVTVDANFMESLTELSTTSRFLAKYQKGEGAQITYEYVVVTSIEDSGVRPGEEYVYVNTFKETSFNYKDETGKLFTLVMNDLVGGTETITTLAMEELPKDGVMKPALVYTKEDGTKDIVFFMDQENIETLTSLSIADDLSGLVYVDENSKKNTIDIKPLIKQPWKKVASADLPVNGDLIYTNGWVGIGFDKPSAEPNEKLRVNGSITAVNSYYADYVFESYFTGASTLKYDYKFNDLNVIESFIKKNNHLPGITPITELSKSEDGYSFNISELSIQLLEKIEELYLHIIEQSKEIKELKQVNSEIEKIKLENVELKIHLQRIEELLKEKLVK